MIEALIGGKIYGKPEKRTSGKGTHYVTGKVRVASDGSQQFINVIAFSDTVCNTLAEMDDGDAVSLCGELSMKPWTDKNGTERQQLSMIAAGILTSYHIQRKRSAVQEG